MLQLFGKKKMTEENVANLFINSLLDVVEEGFEDLIGLVQNDPEFVKSPVISQEDSHKFLLIVIAGNMKFIPKYFDNGSDQRIMNIVLDKWSKVFGVDRSKFETILNDYKALLTKVNYPSKNTLYAMSKAFFHKYDLNVYQDEYFKKMNAPNPLFLKRLNEILGNFVWNWNNFLDRYKVVAA